MSEERLQKILARAGVTSRRKAEELIRDGLVTINGRVAEIGDKADPEHDAIKVEGKRIQPGHPHLYLVLNKPKGVVSTLADPEGRATILDFIPPQFRKAIVPVGRLDYNTEGLLLLTDDGEFAQRVSHPRYGCWKTYEVKVKGRPTEEQLDRLRSGVVLEGRRTAPCRIEPRGGTAPPKRSRGKKKGAAGAEDPDNASWWNVELAEGRTRQIREMFFQAGHPVQKLRRVAIGPLRDPDLPVGALRELSEREVERLRKAARPNPRKEAAAGPRKKAAPKGDGDSRPAKRAAGAKPAGRKAADSQVDARSSARSVLRRPVADSYGEVTSTRRSEASPARPAAGAAAWASAGPAKKPATGGRKAAAPRGGGPARKAGAPARRKPGTRGPRPATPQGSRGPRGGAGRRTRG